MKEKLQRFMTGRYGIDNLNRFLLICALVLCVTNMLFRSSILNTLILLVIVIMYVRMLSRNASKRYAENVKFLQLKEKVTGVFRKNKANMEDRKTNHIYACPSCKQKIRIPKGKGRICITCPKCHTQFERKS